MFEDLIIAFYLLITIVQKRWFCCECNAYSIVGVSHAERKHWSLWPTFYVDTTTNRNIPAKNCVLFVSLYALHTNMNRIHHQPLLPCCLFWFGFVSNSVYTTVAQVRESNFKTSYLFDINCHFHALFVTLLNINVKPLFLQPWIPLKNSKQ